MHKRVLKGQNVVKVNLKTENAQSKIKMQIQKIKIQKNQ